MGLTYDQAMDIPLSLLYDLISINQIKKEGFKYKRPRRSDREELMELFKLK